MIKRKSSIKYKTGEICSRFDISRATLFRWESEDLLTKIERDWRGWRAYTERNFKNIEKIMKSKNFGEALPQSSILRNIKRGVMLTNKVRVLKSQTIILITLCMLLSGCATMLAPGSDHVTIKTYPAGGAKEKARAGEVITIAAVGDIMMGSDYPEAELPSRDGEGIFDAVKQAFSGQDIVFGNLEGPLLDGGASTKCEKLSRCFAFRTPTRYVRYLREAGFTAVSVANNHASDFGDEGRESTLRTLASTGIQAVGGKAVARFTIKGKKIALAGFSYSTPSRYSFSLLDIPEATRIVRDLKKENDLVIVSFHGGAEGNEAQHIPGKAEVFMGEERGDVVRFARAVIDAGADLVIGHGPHVLRAMEVYRGKLIAYSLGNFLTYERFNIDGPSGRSAVLQACLDMETGNFLSGMLVPVRLVNEGIPEPDPERQAIDLMKSLTRKDMLQSGIVISADGTIASDGRKEKAEADIGLPLKSGRQVRSHDLGSDR